ncbi:Wzz/FepE/Etk N-terminal domain-containing protein [Thermovibrio sp.]
MGKGSYHQNSCEYTYEDEIDLYELYLVLKKRKWVILITVLLFILGALAYVFVKTPLYEIKHTYSVYPKLPKPVFDNLPYQVKSSISVLSDYLDNKNYKAIASLLSISYDDARRIDSFSVDTSRKGAVFSLIVKSTKPSLLPKLDKALFSYVKERPSIKKVRESYLSTLKAQLKTIEENIGKVKKIVGRVENSLMKGNIKVLGFNPVSVETELLKLEAQELSLKEEVKNFSLFNSVSTYFPKEPVEPKVKLILAVSFVSGLFFGIFLAFFFEWIDKVKRRA